jgi:hypothetical protein
VLTLHAKAALSQPFLAKKIFCLTHRHYDILERKNLCCSSGDWGNVMKSKKPQVMRRRKTIDASSDPYLHGKTIQGIALCLNCHAVFTKKRWKLDEPLFEEKYADEKTAKILCPACRKVKEQYPGGIVNLRGRFIDHHREEVLNLVRNEEKRARGFNPLERIMDIQNSASGIVIRTTNEKLAQRIGRRMQKAYQGKVYYTWSDDTKLLRAEWERDQD